MARAFGHVPGVAVGLVFANRKELAQSGVHRPLVAGISGGGKEGADSVVLSGGYEDDQDNGDTIVYTGHGGNDPNTGRQIADQQLTVGNLALARNRSEGLPVRVIRGAGLESVYAPETGFRYDGLYYVEDCWHERGKSGFLVWRFRLSRGESGLPPTQNAPPSRPMPAERKQVLVVRIVRDTMVSRRVKELHGFFCQVCDLRLESVAGPYAEGAHIRPLGSPHDGPDAPDNILCLCPNHHVLFDLGAFTIADDLTLIGLPGRLRTANGHPLNALHLSYHRSHYGAVKGT
jgi:putative restriction endonuclease